MTNELVDAINEQIAFLEKNAAPKGQEAIHMECLNALRQARAGNYEEIENFRKMAADIAVAARNPVTREMVKTKKIELSKDNPEYAAVLQNNALQSSIETAEDAIYQPALQSVMYMLKIVSPVTSLMENPDQG